MITNLLSTGAVSVLRTLEEGSTAFIAFSKIANPFIGIIAGIIGALCYNRFKSTKLPDWLSFFSGKRCVAIVAGVVSIVVSAVLLFVWPVIFGGLVALGKGIEGMGALGAGIYAFFNRLLIPFGLHHALNNVFWFDTICRCNMEPWNVHVRILPMYDVWYPWSSSCYDSVCKEQ